MLLLKQHQLPGEKMLFECLDTSRLHCTQGCGELQDPFRGSVSQYSVDGSRHFIFWHRGREDESLAEFTAEFAEAFEL